MTFEDYLKDKHADEYRGVDDDMPDSFEWWKQGLIDTRQYEQYRNEWKQLKRDLDEDTL